jgi:hypothetical protein
MIPFLSREMNKIGILKIFNYLVYVALFLPFIPFNQQVTNNTIVREHII